MQKGTPKSMFLAQKFARGPLAPERGVLSSGAESVCVYVFHSMIFSFVFIFLVQIPFAIILFFLQDRILKARETPDPETSKWGVLFGSVF